MRSYLHILSNSTVAPLSAYEPFIFTYFLIECVEIEEEEKEEEEMKKKKKKKKKKFSCGKPHSVGGGVL